jgi:UDP-3-O-[3-hydroxymyristoyl] N-acetylglucosamine deacetylase
MESVSFRSTLWESVTVKGIGIHTGESATVHLHPARAGTGIVFQVGSVRIPALSANVVDTSRCTVLGKDGVRLATVEHLLSACAGWDMTDLIVEVDGPELPIGDGSAAVWTDAFQEGRRDTFYRISPPRIKQPIIVTGKGGAFIALYPAQELSLTVAVTFEHPLIQTQIAHYSLSSDAGSYAQEIAPARTFGFIEEVEALRAAGLARGGSLDNAVVIYPEHYSVPLRFTNELARHKLLDLMGDLLLATGASLPVADIIAVKPSHRLNCDAAKEIAVQHAMG